MFKSSSNQVQIKFKSSSNQVQVMLKFRYSEKSTKNVAHHHNLMSVKKRVEDGPNICDLLRISELEKYVKQVQFTLLVISSRARISNSMGLMSGFSSLILFMALMYSRLFLSNSAKAGSMFSSSSKSLNQIGREN
jgi:hypothetical protein